MKHLRPAIGFTLFFILVTGFAFPALIFGLSQVFFPHQANGSLIKGPNGQLVGSKLIGQSFSEPKYFHPRPSAAGNGYDAANSGATNLGPTSDKLINGVHDPKNQAGDFDGVNDLAKKYRAENGMASSDPIPADAVTRSASGLDPEISVANAELQAGRVAKARGLDIKLVLALIPTYTSSRVVGVFGDPGVNVLKLNLALDSRVP